MDHAGPIRAEALIVAAPTRTRVERLEQIVRVLAVVLAGSLLVRGLGYIGPAAPNPVPDSLSPLESLFPLQAWSIACFTIVLMLIVGIIWKRSVYVIGLILYSSINGAWIMSYFTAWAFGISERSYITAANYCPELALAIALLVIGPPWPIARRRMS